MDRVLRILEYDKIAAMTAEFTASDIGRERAAAMTPSYRFDEVRRALTLTAEALSMLRAAGRTPVDSFPDMRECLKRMRAALYLGTGELLGIAKCLRAARMAKEYICADGAEGLLVNMASSLMPHRSIEEEISRCIISEDEIFDGASSELSRIRRAMRVVNERVRDRLNSMIRSSSYQKYLQEPLITIRNGRFVIPVKQEYRQNVPGLIHDQSGSGATLFIEPNAVVELGNEYKKLLGDETEEIERILAELTALIAPYADDIREDMELLGDIDLIFAKARLALEQNAAMPELNREGRVRIIRGRHPLIAADKVVPVDIWLGEGFTTLIITGPNTGGKTVTIKTVGLFSLMAQSGMLIPAAEGSETAVFESVYADIGDEQSIEQSLSTFSSHMKNIVDILDKADANSLVLLDELGAGTDPVEGAALAMSILAKLHERGAATLATTHYSEIKAFALTREGMENASMEFDVDRLCPTYRLFIGIPGKSNAFEISQRLGLDPSVIESARGYLKREDMQFEDIISSAQSQHRLAEEERAAAERQRLELAQLREENEREHKRLESERSAQKAKAKEEARRIVNDTRREMEKLISDIRSIKGIDQSAADRVIQRARDSLRAHEGTLAESIQRDISDTGNAPAVVHPGDSVIIASLGQKATALSGADAKGDVLVQAGIIKLTVKLSDLRLDKSKEKASDMKVRLDAAHTVGLELDIRGMLVDDAVLVVDRYLDDASAAGLTEVSIIHGKGTGALRAGIQEYLKHHRRVKKYRMGNYGEGDAGVTVVTLK